jgi:conjugal transfer pilus assembly protein TraB
MADTSKRAGAIRKKQLLILAGVILVVAVVSVLASIGFHASQKNDDDTVVKAKTKQITFGNNATDKEAWRAQSSAALDRMAERLKTLEKRMGEGEAAAAKQSQKPASQISAASAPVVPPPVPPATSQKPNQNLFSQIGNGTIPPPPVKPGTGRGQQDQEPGPHIKSLEFGDSGSSSSVTQSLTKNLANNARQAAQNGKKIARGNSAAGQTAGTYLPSGTFIRAALLNGLDAPTGGQAQSNPLPALMRLEDNAQLPNSVKANLKGCFVTGAGHGDLSAERAYIRLDRLSCVDDNGGASDVAVKGYVSGEDGKVGVRGRLVTKSGQVIANALFTGVLSGLGQGFQQASVNTTTYGATGSTCQTVNNAMEYGIGAGFGKGMDRIAQYYIKLADKLFPIVEVDGGRVVDIVLTQGVSIER